MSEHRVNVVWERAGKPFDEKYVRDHEWRFPGGTVVGASSAPELSGNPKLVDPEAAFTASISSCHMMWFLYLTAKAGYVVDDYSDNAVGYLERKSRGVMWVPRVELTPVATFAGTTPSLDELRRLHDESHERCFIANSVMTEIIVNLPS